MSNFETYTNFKENAGVSGVVFGSEKPLLEVELNEMQEIQKTHIRNILHSMIGDGVTNLSSINYIDSKLTITNSMFSVDGIVVQCDSLTLNITDGSAYLQVWEEDADYTSILNKNGNQQSAEIVDNWFKDDRSAIETTKRKVVKYNLTNTSDPTKHNLKIADFSSSVMTLTINEIDISKAIGYIQDQIDSTNNNLEAVSTHLENSKVDKPTQKALVIPNTGWVDEVHGSYLKKLVLSVGGITENMIVEISIALEDEEIAIDCGLAPINESGNGTVTFYAESVPSSSMNATYYAILATE